MPAKVARFCPDQRARRGASLPTMPAAARPLAVVVALIFVGVSTGCGSAGSTTAAPEPAPPVAPRGCPPAGVVASSTAGPYEVGRVEATFVDPSRPTAARPARQLEAHPDRTLPTVILYPTEHGQPANGPFPLVVVS